MRWGIFTLQMKDFLMVPKFRRQPKLVIATMALGLALTTGLSVGLLVGHTWQRPEYTLQGWDIPVSASASVAGPTVAAATGPIDDRIEGLFTIDSLSGRLQCAILYTQGPRQNQFAAVYEASVFEDLNIEGTKKPNYLLLTGYANLARGRGNSGSIQPANCVAYVVDGNTGHFAVYGVPWSPNLVSRGTPQGGSLRLLDVGTARMEQIRE
ncbi:MAG: hypothetical protein MK179_10580 [Pirellulaceae bacterium]|nr:hypothetical protein [Pirellulaceae bacterium]